MLIKSTWLTLLVVLLSACGMTGDQVVYDIYGDSGEDGMLYQRLSDMQFEIEMLTQQSTCNADLECQTVGVGTKPCGGFRYYFAYSNSSSDLTAIMSKVRDYNVLDNKLDHRIETVDKCTVGVDPGASCQAQRCILNF